MPRIANESGALLADLQKRLARLVDVARNEGREDALSDVRRLVAGSGGPGMTKAGKPRKKPGPKPSQKSSKPRKKRKNPWATMTPAQKKERVRKMLAGRGLKPKSDR